MQAWPGCTTNAGWMLAFRNSVRRYFGSKPVANCMFCGKPLTDEEIVTDDNDGIACRPCAAAELAAQRTERRLQKLEQLGFADVAEFASNS